MSKQTGSNKDIQPSDVGSMTLDEYSEWVKEHHDDDVWEPVDIDVSPNLTVVVSVRFSEGELSTVDAAAESAGLALSTYIRQAAMNAAAASATAEDEVRQHLRALTESLRRSQEAAEHLARDVQLSRHRKDGPVAA